MTAAAASATREEAPAAPPPTPLVRLTRPVAASVQARVFWWLTVALLAVGVLGRLSRYLIQFPIWGDEAMLGLNYLDRDYAGLLRVLDGCQVAPILFLWSQRLALRLLGPSEMALRLGPLLTGIASLFLFWRLTRITVKPLPGLLAVGLLAVARWPVSMSTNAKPYSFDLFMALLLLVPAAEWLRRPDRLVWPALLALAVPVSLLGSYPAAFVAGAVSLALLPTAWRSRWAGRTLFVAYNLLMAGAFLAAYWVVGRAQEDPASGAVRNFMLQYWACGFPPAAPLPFLSWFALINTGRMMAYPVGESNGGSVVTFLLFLLGVWSWWKSGRRPLLVLTLTPFALNFLAAVLQRYPYGGCCRLSQHLAPSICLLTGVGLAHLLEKFVRRDSLRLRWTAVLCCLLGLCAVGGMACDFTWPYHDRVARWARAMQRKVLADVRRGDQIVVEQGKDGGIDAVLRWYLETAEKPVRWGGNIDWEGLAADHGRIWVVNWWAQDQGKAPAGPAPLETPAHHGWTLQDRTAFQYMPPKPGDALFFVELSLWLPPTQARALSDFASEKKGPG